MKKNGGVKKGQAMKARSDLPRLQEALQLTSEFTLHFVIFESTDSLSAAFKAIKKTHAKKCRIIELDGIEQKDEPLKWLLDKIDKAPAGSIVILNDIFTGYLKLLEKSQVDLLQEINQNLLELKRFNRPILLPVSYEYIDDIRESAPDLWDWRSGFYFLETVVEDRYRTGNYLHDYFANSEPFVTVSDKKNVLKTYRFKKTELKDMEYDEKILDEFDVLGKMARILYRLGELDDAQGHYNQQLDLAELIGEERLFPEVLNNLALVHQARGDYNTGLNLLNRAWAIAEDRFRGDNNPTKAVLLGNIAVFEFELGDEVTAYQKCRKALRMLEYKIGLHHPDLVPILFKLAFVLRLQGLYDDALDAYRRSLQIIERKLQLNHPYIGVILQNIGGTYFQQGRNEIAKRYIARSLESIEKSVGAEHPYMGRVLNEIGEAHFRCGESEKSLKYFYWALDIRNRTVGTGDLCIAAIYTNVARVYQEMGKGDDARHCFYGALELYKAKLPETHARIKSLNKSLEMLNDSVGSGISSSLS